jgi:hypothetical protein
MERDAGSRGRYARLLAGTEGLEIKATIPERQIEMARDRYGLTTRNDDERYIYFFDTPRLDLLGAGIILRARRVVGGQHDSTVKFRPVDPEQVGKRWRKYRGFKIEADASEEGAVKSASFSMPVERGVIKRVVAGEKRIASLFTEEQEAFLADMTGRMPDLGQLGILGPLRAQRWDFEDRACPWPLTAELWVREDGAKLMEASVKAPSVQAAAVVAGFMAFLAEVGAEHDVHQQAKTRWALEYHAARPRPATKPLVAATKGTVPLVGSKQGTVPVSRKPRGAGRAARPRAGTA